MWIGETAMVHTSVTIKGLRRECMLPVMDNKNNAVKLPDSRKISDAIMRCMTKAISMHGLGLYIYAGEDLPEPEHSGMAPSILQDWLAVIADAGPDNVEALVKDGLEAATEVKDREAFIAIREAGKKRHATTT
jgi:hypothetical protein